MSEIYISADRAERIISQVLRDEGKLLPGSANALAANICRRLYTSMSLPTNQPLQDHRHIQDSPPNLPEFTNAIGEKLGTSNPKTASEVWRLVYDRGEPMPGTVADPRQPHNQNLFTKKRDE
jgi:hypothetical protein